MMRWLAGVWTTVMSGQVHPMFYWLMLLVAFLAVLIVPTALHEYWARSEYRQYLEKRQARERQREAYVAPVRSQPVHRRTIIRGGIVK